ncbi:MAG: hypothetical protein DWQ04_24480 [Chloroflexi bacterium]|nr:MAG: hypothetical protein DWQ04_24480 [Chloroflexota bacterium]
MMKARKQTTLIAKGLLIPLMLVTFAVLYPPFAHGWVGDDYVQLGYVREVVERPFTFLQIFHPTWTIWYYRPTQNLWFLFGQLLFGQQPEIFYAIQIGIHLLAISLIYRIAKQIGLHPYVALGSAALFAIHGHHVDVVTWISAIAIVLAGLFSLAAVSAFLGYLKRPSHANLLLTALFCILALLSHEETILLPPFLLVVLLLNRIKHQGWIRKKSPISNLQSLFSISEKLVFLLLIGLIAVYLIIQLTRPNATIDLSSTSSEQWLTLLSPSTFGDFWLSTLYQFTFWGQLLKLTGLRAAIFVLGTLGLLGIGFWYSNKIVRLGLLWAALHLAFIYLALWAQKPELYAGRHIYNALPGVVLAVGAGVQQGLGVSRKPLAVSRGSSQRTMHDTLPALTGLFVIIVLVFQIAASRRIQGVWLADVTGDQSIEQPLREMMPVVEAETHVFANRLPITPKFLRSVVYVWYGVMPPNLSGSLSKLLDEGEATSDYYVFDYENGRLFNLMPELQQHDKTFLLLAHPITQEIHRDEGVSPVSTEIASMTVAGPENDRRLSLKMNPPADEAVWASQSYINTILPDSSLAFGVLPAADLQVRVLIEASDGRSQVVWESAFLDSEMWQDVEIDLVEWWETAVIIRLEARRYVSEGEPSTAYWSNPRITIN